ncbi:MAG: hypothetical protein V1692_01050 [bacterium]
MVFLTTLVVMLSIFISTTAVASPTMPGNTGGEIFRFDSVHRTFHVNVVKAFPWLTMPVLSDDVQFYFISSYDDSWANKGVGANLMGKYQYGPYQDWVVIGQENFNIDNPPPEYFTQNHPNWTEYYFYNYIAYKIRDSNTGQWSGLIWAGPDSLSIDTNFYSTFEDPYYFGNVGNSIVWIKYRNGEIKGISGNEYVENEVPFVFKVERDKAYMPKINQGVVMHYQVFASDDKEIVAIQMVCGDIQRDLVKSTSNPEKWEVDFIPKNSENPGWYPDANFYAFDQEAWEYRQYLVDKADYTDKEYQKLCSMVGSWGSHYVARP